MIGVLEVCGDNLGRREVRRSFLGIGKGWFCGFRVIGFWWGGFVCYFKGCWILGISVFSWVMRLSVVWNLGSLYLGGYMG